MKETYKKRYHSLRERKIAKEKWYQTAYFRIGLNLGLAMLIGIIGGFVALKLIERIC